MKLSIRYTLSLIMLIYLVSGCASAERIVKVEVSNCSVVPYINLTEKQEDALYLDELFHSVLIAIDKQSQIIDECKK